MEQVSIGKSALLTDLGLCINYYRLSTPGMYVCIHATVQIDKNTRIIPGITAMVNSGKFKQCKPDFENNAFYGAPNFVLDVVDENDSISYQERKDIFEKCGVIEYVLVYDTDPITFEWYRRIKGKFELIREDKEGTIQSSALPGLWIKTEALRIRNWWTVLAGIRQGITRKEHHDFMHTIWHKRKLC